MDNKNKSWEQIAHLLGHKFVKELNLFFAKMEDPRCIGQMTITFSDGSYINMDSETLFNAFTVVKTIADIYIENKGM